MLFYQEDILDILASRTSWFEREYVPFEFFRILSAINQSPWGISLYAKVIKTENITIFLIIRKNVSYLGNKKL